MNISNKPLSCADAKNMDMIDYLLSLGYQPTRISRHHYWYLSPLRNEKTASFKVNRTLNRWYDFGEGKGGNIIGFGILYLKCSVSEFLKQLPHRLAQRQPLLSTSECEKDKEGLIKISKAQKLSSPILLHYPKHRRIDVEIAQTFCKEVKFDLYNKKYFAIGFLNNKGGYELRNSFFKGSNHPKDITTINNKAQNLVIFEGFFDFLSYQTIYKNAEYLSANFIVLNSLSFINRLKPLLPLYNGVHLYLDRDTKGQNCTHDLLSFGSHIQDESHLYQHQKDLNDWLMQFGLPKKPILQTNCITIQQTSNNDMGQPD